MNDNLFRTILKRYEAEIEDANYKIETSKKKINKIRIPVLFGEKGKHARAAISVNALPLGASVEIDAIFEID